MSEPLHSSPPDASPLHEGEIAIQKRLGVHERVAPVSKRVIRDYMPDQHRAFFEQLPFVVAGAVDEGGDVWATLLTGSPGFARSLDPRSLLLDVTPEPDDPAWAGLRPNDSVGLLGIELATRRRNRVNGILGDGPALKIEVTQSFGNCPQYIQTRALREVDREHEPAGEARWSSVLSDTDREIIGASDTFYVASYVDLEAGRQVDVSHRGGKRGFVRVDDDGGLTIPDFAGNLLFNTLGNFLVNPRAGLVFVDWDSGDVLQMTGRTELLFDAPEIGQFEGAERLWRFFPTRIVSRSGALPLRAAFLESSPNSEMTGSWEQARERLAAERQREAWRPFEITRIVDESEGIRSFHLAPSDGAGTTRHEAGQHLPIRVTLPGDAAPSLRTYTISSAPSDDTLRLSVQREGAVSRHLHQLAAGDRIEARAAAGAFTIDAAERRPAVLVAGGIGITPLLAMLRHLVFEGLRTRRTRPTVVFYAARSSAVRAFDNELEALVQRAAGAVRVVRVLSEPGPQDALGSTHEVEGRISGDLFRAALPFGAHDFYLCGPSRFMQAIYDDLRSLDVSDRRIHAEAFGPAALTRRADEGDPRPPLSPVSPDPVPVTFQLSGKEARWTPRSPNLLELAEDRGLSPSFSCRGGSCGSCKVKLSAGEVTYRERPSYPVQPGEALLCRALPADGTGPISVDA